MPWCLRAATEADAADAAALIVAAFFSQPVVVDPPASALGVTAVGLAAHFAGGPATGGLVVASEALVGALLWTVEDDALHLARVAVAADRRRQGIARALLAEAAALGRVRGLHRMVLGTRLALAGNRALFAGAGFREIAQHAHPGYSMPTWVEMACDLGA